MFRVMIVDDESIIRKGLINLIDWNVIDCEVVYGACNGLDARDHLEELHPDIVIADVKMPRMNGIELAEYIHMNHPNIKIIVLTAYADFSFAQAAIKYNVVDFVIKSTGPIENVREAVIKAKNLIFEQEKKEIEIVKNIGEIREKFLQDIINGVVSDSNLIKDRMDELGIILSNYYSLIFEISPDALTKYLPNEQTRFYSSIKNFLSLAFKDYKYYIVSTSNLSFCMLLQPNPDYILDYITSLRAICTEVSSMVDSFMNFKINIGISNFHKSPQEISIAYKEALKALSNNFYNANQSVFQYGSLSDKLTERMLESDYFDKIIQCIKLGESDNAKSILNEFLNKQIAIKQPVERIKNIGLTLYSLCSKFLANCNQSQSDMNSSNDIYSSILNTKSIDHLIDILNNLIDSSSSYLSSAEKQSNYLINKAINYIKENYKDEISLQQVANYVHINSSYLSRLFSNETGATFTNFVNDIRIEKAKELLLNTELNTLEIASSIGISDSTYFIRLFKKHVGHTPQTFRQMNIKNDL